MSRRYTVLLKVTERNTLQVRNKITGPLAAINLFANDVFPGGFTGVSTAGHTKNNRAIHQARKCARLNSGCRYLVERDLTKELTETFYYFIQ